MNAVVSRNKDAWVTDGAEVVPFERAAPSGFLWTGILPEDRSTTRAIGLTYMEALAQKHTCLRCGIVTASERTSGNDILQHVKHSPSVAISIISL